jgi:hypothetical protein
MRSSFQISKRRDDGQVAPILEESLSKQGGRVNDQSRVFTSAVVGALVGAAAGYLFFTERGKSVRDRIEPAIDELRSEFARFQRTFEKVGEMASDGLRVVNEFNTARSSQLRSGSTPH